MGWGDFFWGAVFFWALLLCLRGGGSFRSGVQPPTGSSRGHPDRDRDRLKGDRHSFFWGEGV